VKSKKPEDGKENGKRPRKRVGRCNSHRVNHKKSVVKKANVQVTKESIVRTRREEIYEKVGGGAVSQGNAKIT